tara:strand:+ start:12572 stop:12970 length:399 start_codon:yes stop_codon:yes gene_type:complete
MSAKISLDEAEKLDITCRQGDSFTMTVTLKDSTGTAIDISSGYDFLMQVRKRNRNRDLVIGTVGVGDVGPVNFTFANPSSNGTVDITLSAANMRSVEPGRYVYDVQYATESETKTFLEGTFKVNRDVAKAVA